MVTTIDIFGDRFLLDCSDCGTAEARIIDPIVTFELRGTPRGLAAQIQERAEMVHGVRCADCGKRFRGNCHEGCIPF